MRVSRLAAWSSPAWPKSGERQSCRCCRPGRAAETQPVQSEGTKVLNPQGKRRRVDSHGGCQGPENRGLETHRQAQSPHGAGEVQTAISPSPEKGDSETDDAREQSDNSARRPRDVANLFLGTVPGVD